MRKTARAFDAEAMELVSDFVKAHLGESICLNEMARHVGMSKTAFCKGFRAYLGMSPYRYVIECRLAHASALIRLGMAVGEAAVQVGFSDHSHLTRHFRRIVGYAPTHRARSL